MPAVNETTPLWPQDATNTNHRGEPYTEDDDEHEPQHSLLRHNTVELGPPADPWRISYWIMVIQGASMLLPWNGKHRRTMQCGLASNSASALTTKLCSAPF